MNSIEITEEGVVYCDTLTCTMSTVDSMCDDCPLRRIVRHLVSVELTKRENRRKLRDSNKECTENP